MHGVRELPLLGIRPADKSDRPKRSRTLPRRRKGATRCSKSPHTGSGTRIPHRLPDALAGRRHVEAFDPERRERTDDGVDDRRQRADCAGLARALGAQWMRLVGTGFEVISMYGIVSARGMQ